MKRTLSRFSLILFLLIPFTHSTSHAQNLTGIWRGYFVTELYDQYKFELQLKQTGNSISGVSYSYHSTVFYGKATLTGSFNATGQSALIREIKTVELRMDAGSAACIMKCIFEYDRSGKEEFLEGTFTSKYEKSDSSRDIRRGEPCGGGRVFLRKVTTSDFYVEQFLRNGIKTNTPVIINKPPIKKDPVKKITTTPPVKKPASANKPVIKPKTTAPLIVKKKPPVITKPPSTNKPIVKTNTNTVKTNIPVKQKIDSAQKIQLPTVKNNLTNHIISTPDVLNTRKNELVKVLIVNDPDVTVKLYDNGEIDGDTISVYLDKKLVLASQGLTASPLTIKLKMDEDNSEHELVMVAENLGRIPPNTSLMIVESGEQRFDVRITSTEQKNAMVRFRYQKPK